MSQWLVGSALGRESTTEGPEMSTTPPDLHAELLKELQELGTL